MKGLLVVTSIQQLPLVDQCRDNQLVQSRQLDHFAWEVTLDSGLVLSYILYGAFCYIIFPREICRFVAPIDQKRVCGKTIIVENCTTRVFFFLSQVQTLLQVTWYSQCSAAEPPCITEEPLKRLCTMPDHMLLSNKVKCQKANLLVLVGEIFWHRCVCEPELRLMPSF